MDVLKLSSINIEGDRHLDRVALFLKETKPDILCLQELFEADVPFFERMVGPGTFVPSMEITKPNRFFEKTGRWGLGLFTKRKISEIQTYTYKGESDQLPVFVPEDPNSGNRVVVVAKVYADLLPVAIATTHFTWSPGGGTTELQRQTLTRLLEVLSHHKPLILCGDMNAPRGGEIFARLAEEYRDCIPTELESSIDPRLHRVKHLRLMVDGLFASSSYRVSGVRLVSGVSDHMAIVASVHPL